jgi:hypothetical protein
MVISDFRFNSFVAAQLCDLGKIGHRLQQFGALCHETVQTLGVKVPVPDAPRRAKRASIESESAELERQIRRHRSEVMQIDSTNTTVRPEPAPGQARRKLVPAIGALHDRELTRRCQTAFREDKGRPLTADGIAVQAMKGKNLDMGDGALRQDITRRFMWTLAQMLKTGIVTKQGWGADARWGMPTGNWAGDTLI